MVRQPPILKSGWAAVEIWTEERGDRGSVKKGELPISVIPGGGGDDMGHLIEESPLLTALGKACPQGLGPGAGAAIAVPIPGQIPLGQALIWKCLVQMAKKIFPLPLPHGDAETGVDKAGTRIGRLVHHGQDLFRPVL